MHYISIRVEQVIFLPDPSVATIETTKYLVDEETVDILGSIQYYQILTKSANFSLQCTADMAN